MIESGFDQANPDLTRVFGVFTVPNPWIAFLLLGLVFVVLPLAGLWLSNRLERRLVARRPAPVTVDSDSAAVRGFLASLVASLRLPAGVVADVRDEIAGHIEDTAAGLVQDGLSRADAVHRAVSALGPPEALARAIGHAQQTRRRQLAGAGGGVFGVASGVLGGIWIGWVVLLPAFIAFTVVAAMAGRSGVRPGNGAPLDIVTLLATAIALAYGARQAVQMTAAITRRPMSQVRWVWALVGAPVVLWVVLFLAQQPQAWLYLPLELALPVAFTFGAMVRLDRSWVSLSWRRFLVASGVLAALLLLVGAGSPEYAPYPDEAVHGIDLVAPAPPAGVVPQTDKYLGDTGLEADCSVDADAVAACTFDTGPDEAGRTLDRTWHGLRLEVWHATVDGYSHPTGVATGSTGPTLIGPVGPGRHGLRGTIDIGMRRDGSSWWLTLTGVGRDGVRYRLSQGDGVEIPFRGTFVAWLRAPG